jgi:hypothetical protein
MFVFYLEFVHFLKNFIYSQYFINLAHRNKYGDEKIAVISRSPFPEVFDVTSYMLECPFLVAAVIFYLIICVIL